MITRINLAIDVRRILDLAGLFIIYTELCIASQVSAAENSGIYYILMNTVYTDDILDVPVLDSVPFSVNNGVEVFIKYIMSIY